MNFALRTLRVAGAMYVLLAIMGMIILTMPNLDLEIQPGPTYGLLGVILLWGILCFLVPGTRLMNVYRRRPGIISWGFTLWETVLLSVLVYFSGGLQSPFIPFYLMVGLFAATRLIPRQVLVVLVFIIISYITALLGAKDLNTTLWPLSLLHVAYITMSIGFVSRLLTELNRQAQVREQVMQALWQIGRRVREMAGEVAALAESQSAAIEQMSSGSTQVAITVQEIAQGASLQAQQVEAISQAAEGIALVAEQIAQGAHGVGEASRLAQSTVEHSVAVLQALAHKSRQIDHIVTQVEKFADQTHLLALNAAIEAARAGEHGRGFAVVADEVGRLAESSARAAGEIADLAREIRQEMDRLIQSTQEVTQSVGQVSQLADEAAIATRQQVEGTESASKAANEVAAVAEENAAAAEEVSVALEEQMSTAQEIALSAQQLAELAASLEALVNRLATEGKE